MSMLRVRENYTYRRLDVAFPTAALNEMHVMIMEKIKAGVEIVSQRSGPMVTKFPKHSATVSNWVMLVDERHATQLTLQMSEIAAKYPVPIEDFHGFGD